jgi:signal transduction histidine kinase
MITAPLPANEQDRLRELYELELLDSPYEEEFDELVRLASQICNAPISLISLIDHDRQWFKAKIGMEDTETDRSVSFCSHAILESDVLVVNNAQEDVRFWNNPFVTDDPHIRFYAGIPLTTKAGYKLGTLCVIDTVPRDLTDEQRFALKVLSRQTMKLFEARVANKLIAHHRQELQALTETQTRIISLMAHDIRNPLGSLQTMLGLIEDEGLDEPASKEMLSLSRRELRGTLEMLNNLVDWGSLQLNGQSVQKRPVHLHALVQLELDTIEGVAQLKGNRLNNEVPFHFVLESDEHALRFVLRNALSNAQKFTENGHIHVSAVREPRGRTRLCVRDTGIGMPESTRRSLFDAHQRTTTPGTKQEKGSGLGLLLVREYLGKIGATFDLRSEPGKGTEVMVLL